MKKILKFVLIIIIVILIIIVLNFVRNYYIINKLHTFSHKNIEEVDSYYINYINTFPGQLGVNEEFKIIKLSADVYYKDNTYLMKLYINDEISTLYWYNENSKEEIIKEYGELQFLTPESMFSTIENDIVFNKEKYVFFEYWSSVIYSNENCYELIKFPYMKKYDGQKLSYDKNNGLLINNKYSQSCETTINYKFNKVLPENIEKPQDN